jgi:outer membrane protein OmpA-like peptidoglycan-associated protein
MPRLALILLLLFCSGRALALPADTTRLYFDLDVDSLSNASKQKLEVLLRNSHIDRSKSVIIIGYTDYLGTEDYNIVLSKERARNVAYYLLENNISEDNITVCMGRGKIERKGVSGGRGYASDRRVDIVIVDKPRKPVVKEKKPPSRPKDPMDVNVVVRPGSRREPIPEDMRNIPLYRESAPAKPSKPGTSYKINDSGNVYVVMRPGGDKPEIPPAIKEAVPAENRADPYKNKNEIDLSQVNAGETFVLRNIYFHPQSHTVRDESIPEMEKLANALKKYPKLKIQVEGHICCVLDFPDAYDVDAQNNHLSVNRAKYIYEYLLTKGIARERLKYAGFGRSKPVVELEKTEEEANKNRRVEIRVLEK